MNNARRKQIEQIRERLDAMKTLGEEIASDLDTIKDEGQEAFDNMPESLQNGDRGQHAQEALDNLENGHSDLESLISSIDDVLTSLESAAE